MTSLFRSLSANNKISTAVRSFILCALGLFILFLLDAMTPAQAHSLFENVPGSLAGGALQERQLGMSAAVVGRAGQTPNSSSQPTGLLLGDEASYGENGLLLQAWTASLLQPVSSSSWVTLGVGTHGGHGSEADHETSIDVEELAMSHYRQSAAGNRWLFTLGRQSKAPQSWLNWHADEGIESVPSLLGDVFMSRHRVDTGASVGVLLGSTQLGVNVWNGNAWPATAGEGLVDLVASHQRTLGSFTVDAGVFLSAGQAVERGVAEDSHTHDEVVSNPVFTGDSRLAGLSLSIASDSHAHFLWSLQASVLVAHESGVLELDAQQTGLRSDTQGLRLHAQLERRGRGVWLRYERLSIDNHLSGAGGQVMAEAAGIADVQGYPARTVLGGWWQALPALRWQLALQRESDGSEAAWQGWLALQWSQQWS